MRLVAAIPMLISAIALISTLSKIPSTLAKEVEVTKDWQLLGQNDTVPQGVHVRMDMTTGEKWVKALDDEDDNKATGKSIQGSESPESQNSVGISSVMLDPRNGEARAEPSEKAADYDYEMMHRTLSKLPEEEKKEMGLPELDYQPDGTRKELTAREKALFESRMKQIWEERQKKLKVMQESQMDLPEVLKDRIKRINAYLDNPLSHLRELVQNDESDEHDDGADEGIVTHILSVLKDLEFQLCDVDMARDFHTLGGWPMLVSLLDDESHVPINNTLVTEREHRQLTAKAQLVQAHAAWAIGTAVKNTGEFFPYAVEPIVLVGSASSGTTTALDALVDLFCKSNDVEITPESRKLMERSIYGLGSLLRGNLLAMRHIQSNDSASRLGAVLTRLVSERSSTSSPATNVKLTQRLLSLCGDIISHILLHEPFEEAKENDAAIRSFATAEWCGATMDVLVDWLALSSIQFQETTLRTAKNLSEYCMWDEASAKKAAESISQAEEAWKHDAHDIDSEHLTELVSIAADIISSLGSRSAEKLS